MAKVFLLPSDVANQSNEPNCKHNGYDSITNSNRRAHISQREVNEQSNTLF